MLIACVGSIACGADHHIDDSSGDPPVAPDPPVGGSGGAASEGGGDGGDGGDGGGRTVDDEGGVPRAALTACPQAADWTTACLSASYLETFHLIDPHRGATCALPIEAGEWLSTTFAVVGDDVYSCRYGQPLRISLSDGAIDSTTGSCHHITRYDGLLLHEDGAITHHADFTSTGLGPGSPLPATMPGALLSVRGDTLYGATLQPDTVATLSLVDGAPGPSIPLVTSGVHLGMSVMPNGELFLLSTDGIDHYTAAGTKLSTTEVPLTGLAGLRCWTLR